MDIITNPTMGWLPWVVFGGILAIAALVGFWNGWRTATYFFVWNISFLIAGVLLFDAFYGSLVDWARSFLPKSSGQGQDFGAILDSTKHIIKPILGVVLLVIVLLVANFLAFLLYWIFRKNLKRRMKDNKQAQISNLGVRLLGTGVGVITAFPIAAFATTLSTLASEDDKFNDIADFMTSGVSFSKFKGSEQAIETIRVSLGMMQAKEGLNALGSAFSGDLSKTSPAAIDKLNKHHAAIQKAMNNPQLLDTLPAIASQFMPHTGTKINTTQLLKNAGSVKKMISPNGNFKSYKINANSKKKIIDMFLQTFVSTSGDEATDKTNIASFMTLSGLFKFI